MPYLYNRKCLSIQNSRLGFLGLTCRSISFINTCNRTFYLQALNQIVYKRATASPPSIPRAMTGLMESAAPVNSVTLVVADGTLAAVAVQSPRAIAAALHINGLVDVIGPTTVHGQSVIVRVVAAVTV